MPVPVRHWQDRDSACAGLAPGLFISLLILRIFYHPSLEIAIGRLLGLSKQKDELPSTPKLSP
jgi:hypothetical protein